MNGAWQMLAQGHLLRAWVNKIWWRMTCHIDCAWCNRRMHRAPLPLKFKLAGEKITRISHTICPSCSAKAWPAGK